MAPGFDASPSPPFRGDATAPELARRTSQPSLRLSRLAYCAGTTRSEAHRYQVPTERQGRQGRASFVSRSGEGSLRRP